VPTVESRDGTQISYEVGGDGPALILVNGALTTKTSGSQAGLAKALTPYFTVFGYDRRGRADSGDTLPYAVEREIEDIDALIDLAGGSAFVYGHSSGACLVLEAALSLGRKVAKIALYEAPYNDDPAVAEPWSSYLNQLAAALRQNRNGDAVALFMSYVGVPAARIEEMRQAPYWPGMEALAPTLAYDHAGIIGKSQAVPAERIAAVSAPALVMCGAASQPFMCVTARTISQTVPGATLKTLVGQSHEVEPAALAPVLIAFFTAI